MAYPWLSAGDAATYLATDKSPGHRGVAKLQLAADRIPHGACLRPAPGGTLEGEGQ